MRVFSGIRPTGDIHIGNYLGAIKQWIALQKEHHCLFCIVDWHAITTPFDPQKIKSYIQKLAVTYLAAGVNPQKSILFVQSHIKEHIELTWLLSSITPLGELSRMTQYKEKSAGLKQKSNAGLLTYPILMAADILLYQTEIVPVGEDQVQHVEFARTLAQKFNHKFGQTFKLPKAVVPESGARIRCLQDPNKKMSKTGNPKGCIGLFDTPKEIERKVMSAVTDAGKEIKYDLKNKPGIANLLTIYHLFDGQGIKEIEKEFQNQGYAQFKKALAKLLIESLKPFREAEKKYSAKEIQRILDTGAQKAQKLASQTIKLANRNMGLS